MKNSIEHIIRFFSFVLIFLMSENYALAQPANDACAGAVSMTPNGTCVTGTTVAATDSWQGTVGCQTGNNNSNHRDVWYSFVATGTQAVITVTNTTLVGDVEIVLVEGTCNTTFTLVGSQCGASPQTGTFNGLTIGATYYYTVSSVPSSTQGTFSTCVTTTTPPVASGQDCGTAAILCNAAPFSQGTSNAGAGSQFGNTSNENLSALGCLAWDERQSKWYKFSIGCTGTISFLLDPNTNSNDYDWAIYDITSSGCVLTPGGSATGGATQVACNFSACPGNTGIVPVGTDPCTLTNFTGCANSPTNCDAGDVAQFNTTPPTVTAGRIYALVIDNFSMTNAGFAFSWTAGTAVIGPNANFTYASPSCGTYNFTKTCAISPSTNSTYLWTFGDGGTSTLQNPSYTYASPGTYTVSLTVTDLLGCSETTSQTITYSAPVATATPNSVAICSGNAAGITLSSSITGTTYSWTVVQSGVSGGSSGTGTSINQTLSNGTTVAGSATYTITPTAAGCAGSPILVTVIVNPIPTAVINGTSPICSGGNTSISLSSNVGGTTFSWTVSQTNVSGGTGGSGNSIVQTLSTTTNTPGSAVYTVTPLANSCSGSPVSYTITVNPSPTGSFSGPTSICSGGNTSINLNSNVSGTTFSWTVVQNQTSGASAGSGNSINQTLNATSLTPGTATYTITPSASSCSGPPFVIAVTVNPIPTGTYSGVTNLCSGTTSSINLSSNVSGATFSWTISQTGTTGSSGSSGNVIAQTLFATTSSAGTVTYSVTPNMNGCPGSVFTIPVTVFPVPSLGFSGGTTICSGNTTSINLTSTVSGTSFSWTQVATNVSGSSDGTGVSIGQTLTNTGTISGTVVYSISGLANGCPSIPLSITITVNPRPSGSYTGSTTICSGSAVSLALSANVVGTTFSWTAAPTGVSGSSAGSGNTISNTLNNSGNIPAHVVYTVTPSFSGCTGTPLSINVTVNPRANPSFTGPTTLCSGNSTALNLFSSVVGTTFTWTQTSTGISGSANGSGNSIVQNLITTGNSAGSVTYSITTSANACPGNSLNITVNVNPTPVGSFTGDTQLCSGSALSIALSSTLVGTSFSWIAPSSGVSGASAGSGSAINQTLTATGTSNGTVNYTVIPTLGSCTGTAFAFSVLVIPFPSTPTLTPSPLCTSIPVTLNSASSGTYYQFLINGVNQSGTITSNSYGSVVLNSSDVVCVRSFANLSGTLEGCYRETCMNATTSTSPNWTDIDLCAGAANPLLNISPSGIAGVWTPTFDPNNSGSYTFTPNSGQCSSAQTIAVGIVPPVTSGPILHD